MPVWHAILLGAIQGLTEFLPVSSTAHLLLAQRLLGYPQDQLERDPFTIVIQLGTLISVFAFFRRDIVALTKAFARDLWAGRVVAGGTPDGRLVKLIIVGTIPVGVVGLVLQKWLKEQFYNPPAIAVVSITFALLMAAAEWSAGRRARRGDVPRTSDDLTVWDALLIGTFQALALMPGGSRSGTTLTAAFFAGLGRPAAARFSFLLSLPAVLAAGLKSLYDWRKSDAPGDPTAMLVGAGVAAVVGYAAIAWLMRFLGRSPLWAFVAYRILLGTIILATLALGWW